MPSKCSAQLALAIRNKLLVGFTRPLEQGTVNGYVLDAGPRFFLIAYLDEYIRLNGFQCFRVADVRRLQVPPKDAGFYEAALSKRNQRRPPRPPVNLSSIEPLLLSAGRAFPLVTIHRELADPDVCHIGRVIDAAKGRVSLLEIGSDAVWDRKPTQYRLSEITRVDFGGAYEEALALVGGAGPATPGPSERHRIH